MKVFAVLLLLLLAGSVSSQTNDETHLQTTNDNLRSALQKGDYKNAAKYAEEAVALSERLFSQENREIGVANQNLGFVLIRGGKYKLAVVPLRKALEIFRKDQTRNAADIAKVMQRLGEALAESGEKKEAEALYAEALNVAKAGSGENSREYIAALVSSACFYHGSRKIARGTDDLIKAYTLTIDNFGRDGQELDQVALACDGALAHALWSDQRRSEDTRKRLSTALGYEVGKPAKLNNPDFDARLSDAGRSDITGYTVIVKVWVNEQGAAARSIVVYGRSALGEASIDALKDSKFQPSTRNGKPVPDVFYVPFFFLR